MTEQLALWAPAPTPAPPPPQPRYGWTWRPSYLTRGELFCEPHEGCLVSLQPEGARWAWAVFSKGQVVEGVGNTREAAERAARKAVER